VHPANTVPFEDLAGVPQVAPFAKRSVSRAQVFMAAVFRYG
jgi:hypothetical protein